MLSRLEMLRRSGSSVRSVSNAAIPAVGRPAMQRAVTTGTIAYPVQLVDRPPEFRAARAPSLAAAERVHQHDAQVGHAGHSLD